MHDRALTHGRRCIISKSNDTAMQKCTVSYTVLQELSIFNAWPCIICTPRHRLSELKLWFYMAMLICTTGHVEAFTLIFQVLIPFIDFRNLFSWQNIASLLIYGLMDVEILSVGSIIPIKRQISQNKRIAIKEKHSWSNPPLNQRNIRGTLVKLGVKNSEIRGLSTPSCLSLACL